jgi:mannose-6-phosphate isomerase-like protein (cupin superfamily)
MKQLRFSLISIFVAILAIGAVIAINSSVYDWEKLEIKKTSEGEVRAILSGPTQTLAMFEVKAITLFPGKSAKEYKVEDSFDELIIIKEGLAEITIENQANTLSEGSVVVLSQGNKVKIRNKGNNKITYYSFLFKPRVNPGSNQKLKVTPVVRDWKTIEYKQNANGGRRDIVKQATSSLKELEMHTTLLNAGLPSHAAHNHPDEEIILVRFGLVEQIISDKSYKLGPGSVIFVTNTDNHGIRNAGTDKCEYYAIRWLTYP